MRSLPVNSRLTDAHETRCGCGHLVAILRIDGVELKCKRCKRIVLVPYSNPMAPRTMTEPCLGVKLELPSDGRV